MGTQKIGVAIIHGIGDQGPDFAEPMIEKLIERFADALPASIEYPENELVIESAYWAPELQTRENALWRKVSRSDDIDFRSLRKFLIGAVADAIAYQPLPQEKKVYDSIHKIVAQTIHKIAETGGRKIPLVVIAHSLGTVIASNYFYDLEHRTKKKLIAKEVSREIGNAPVERGETLTYLYTIGSPILMWSLRYEDFGSPIHVPSEQLTKHYPGLDGGWYNFYDSDDVIGYPLRRINDAYKNAVRKDIPVKVGNILTGWSPMAHTAYWGDSDVVDPIADDLVKMWKTLNS